MTIRQRIKENREDITDWLIHFTRSTTVDAKHNLWSIIESGRLRATWADRNGPRTVYGPHPAVCFSEQPLGQFQGYVNAYEDRGKVAPYGILVKKSTLFGEGARPVIYGLSDTVEVDPDQHEFDDNCRVLRGLPAEEQYRYVIFGGAIDWTHEREWRWPARSDEAKTAGYAISLGPSHVLVETEAEAKNLINTIETTMADRTDWWAQRLLSKRSRVLSLEKLGALGSKNVEEFLRAVEQDPTATV